MAEWTFGGIPFEWLRNSDGTIPTWNRDVRITKRHLIGTDRIEINRIGYGAPVITGQIYCSEAAKTALSSKHGTSDYLNDGVSTVQAFLELTLMELAPGGGYIGTATFTQLSIF